jgi:hypothetical protein
MQDSASLSALERPFNALGLVGNDPWLPVVRTALTFGLVTLIVWCYRSDAFFMPDGSARPWSYYNNEYGRSSDYAWWMLPLGAALFVGLFV